MFVEGSASVKPGQAPPAAPIHTAEEELVRAPTEWIEREIGELAAHIAAATCRWLELVAEFDLRNGHEAWGFHSCGAWVAWCCSIDPRSAREHVRVARALGELPAVRERFRRGELSYSKVRAITRIATPQIEAELVEMARFATAAQLERLMRGYRQAVSAESAAAAHRNRFLACEWDEDGCLCIRGRLAPEGGALLLKALEAGREAIRERCGGHEEEAQGGSAEPEPPQRANDADALMQVAEDALAGERGARAAGERYQVVVHADAEALGGDGKQGCCRLADGPPISAETARRLACEASLISMLHGPKGTLDVGRKTRAIPPSLRRALQARDEGRCRFPGCENRRWVDAPHHALGPWRGDEARQPGPALHSPSPAPARGRLCRLKAGRRQVRLPPPRREGDPLASLPRPRQLRRAARPPPAGRAADHAGNLDAAGAGRALGPQPGGGGGCLRGRGLNASASAGRRRSQRRSFPSLVAAGGLVGRI